MIFAARFPLFALLLSVSSLFAITSPDIPTQNIPCGKTLIVPVTATDPDGGVFSYHVSSSNPNIMVRVRTGNPSLKLIVSYAGEGATPAFTGEMRFQLFRDFTPKTAETIAGLAQGGFYNGLTFHRVVKDFVIQGGDPSGNGSGGPGFQFENEFRPGLVFSGHGQLAMANAGTPQNTFRDSNGSQFFVTVGPQRALDFNHTIFGQLVSGFDVLEKIRNVPVNPADSKPTTPVIITEATVVPDSNDAVLILSASQKGTATINLVIKTGADDKITKTFTANGVKDTTNSPPILLPEPKVTIPPGGQTTVALKAIDLEFDYLVYTARLVSPDSVIDATIDDEFITIKPAVATYKGPLRLGAGGAQLGADGRGSIQQNPPGSNPLAAFDLNPITVWVTNKVVKASSRDLNAVEDVANTNRVVAVFSDSEQSLPTEFTATINWGDGTAITTGTIVAADAGGVNRFEVRGTHTYANPGIYPLTVDIKHAEIEKTARGSVVVTANSLKVDGGEITVFGGQLNQRTVATFQDSAPAALGDYSARIDWGDGVTTSGVVLARAEGGFKVVGSHSYADSGAFAVAVRVRKALTSGFSVAFAWSRVTVKNGPAPQHLPPFPQSHLVGGWNSIKQTCTGSGASRQCYISGQIVVINSGNRFTGPSSLQFYLSNDAKLDADTDTLLTLDPPITMGPITPTFGNNFDFEKTETRDTRIKLPAGVTATGKQILVKMNYSDPLADCEKIDRTFNSGPVRPAIIIEPKKNLVTTEAGGTDTFTVVLSDLPTANVTIAFSSSDAAEGTITPGSITFTPASGLTPQTVTVVGQNDGVDDGDVAWRVVTAPAQSTDPRFSGLNSPNVHVVNIDNDGAASAQAASSTATQSTFAEHRLAWDFDHREQSAIDFLELLPSTEDPAE